MPIRFRCPQCDRMLGIARRKAGTQTECPQCGKILTVPVQDDRTELDDLDILLNPNVSANGGPSHKPKADPPRPAPPVVVAHLLPPPIPSSPKPATARGGIVGSPAVVAPPKPRPPQPPPLRKPHAHDDPPLFEKGDVDAMLGIVKTGKEKLELDAAGAPRVKPVSGMDALSLASDATKLVLSPGKATLLAVAVVVLLGVAFAAGYLIAAK